MQKYSMLSPWDTLVPGSPIIIPIIIIWWIATAGRCVFVGCSTAVDGSHQRRIHLKDRLSDDVQWCCMDGQVAEHLSLSEQNRIDHDDRVDDVLCMKTIVSSLRKSDAIQSESCDATQ